MLPLSILDLAFVAEGQSAREALAGTVTFAQRAEARGYTRLWYAEHHNMPSSASSAPSVLIAHVAANTRTIRLGAGGIMLPNHAPLMIAEQFGTLASLHPGRIDLGLGRAPGTDQVTLRALRIDPMESEAFPDDVLELRGYLGDESLRCPVRAMPGAGTHVPLYILGSSTFGAQLAAQLGLPYAFASHFAPAALEDACAIYRRRFQPSEQLDKPYVIAGVNVVAADDHATAEAHARKVWLLRVKALLGRGQNWSDAQAQAVLESPGGQSLRDMARYSAIGTPSEVRAILERFAKTSGADELMTVHPAQSLEARLRSIDLLADVWLT